MNARKKTWVKLTRPALRGGSVTQALCATAKRAAAGDCGPACEAMYSLLLSNTELLDFHPGGLQKPDGMSPPDEQLQVTSDEPGLSRKAKGTHTYCVHVLQHALKADVHHQPSNQAMVLHMLPHSH